jgi:hypothetical protein
MTSYRTLQGIRDRMVPLQQELNAACLAESTEAIGRHATTAMAIVDEVLETLRRGGTADDGGDRVDRNLLQAAQRALAQAWESAEKVSLGTSAQEMRARALDFKTLADFANAYVSAALGTEL